MEKLSSSELSIQGRQSDAFQEGTGSNKSKKYFSGRCIAATLMIIPQLIMNIGLGALKGLQVCTFKPGEFMNRQAKKIGTDGDKLSRFCGHIGTFAGIIVGIAVAVPSLLIGAVGGLIRGICKTSDAVKTCLNHGCSEAVKRTADYYKLDMRKIAIIIATAFMIASTTFMLTPFILIGFPPLVCALLIPPALFFSGCNTLLIYAFATFDITNKITSEHKETSAFYAQ